MGYYNFRLVEENPCGHRGETDLYGEGIRKREQLLTNSSEKLFNLKPVEL